MNEVMIIVNPGDNISDVIDLAINCAKLNNCRYAVFRFNDVKIFATKGKSKGEIEKEYDQKLT